MITEDYVSFEVAKLLKEKGFNEPCRASYFKKQINDSFTITNNVLNKLSYAAPTLQMALKWLREIHKININIIYDLQRFVKSDGTKEDMDVYEVDIVTKNGTIYINNYNHYESACEVAIKYCLTNLIK